MEVECIKPRQRSNKLNKPSSKSVVPNQAPPQVLLGPPRVKPGRLSVSRTFGDIEAKIPAYGGNPKVVIAVPEIEDFAINPTMDYLFLG